ncbi:MAG: RES family NAD+ phosphorylase [Shewanella sp.]|nr:RES family NAD+ phosphorylase [Shewanella sp.]
MEIEVSKFFLEIDQHLRTKNRFSLPENCEFRVNAFCKFYINNLTELKAGTEYFRARIWGVSQTRSFPHTEMGAPPAHLVGSGRINPEGIPHLYGASNFQSAVSEVRPWVGAHISVARFRALKKLKLVDLTKRPNMSFNSRDHKEQEIITGLQLVINTNFINQLFFAAPAHEHDNLSYITSQFIAERFKSLGADGILYPSVLSDEGLNICIFEPSNAEIQNGVEKVTVHKVTIEAS